MAKTEKITDDYTKESIQYPYISARSLRVELSPTEYVWMGTGEVLSFESGETLGKWVQDKMDKIIEESEPESY